MQGDDLFSYRFTPDVLEMIMDKSLTLFQYFTYLHPILKKRMHFESTRNIQQPQKQKQSSNEKISSLTNRLQEESYSYELIEECLDSKQFIEKLHPYINSLLTTTNIGIVKQTLKIFALMQTKYQKFKALARIKDLVSILTLHQIQKNITHIIGSLQSLNSILFRIGLIISPSQFHFYYHQIWTEIPQEKLEVGHPLNGSRKIGVKYLQICDVLALGVEMEEVGVLKGGLRGWMDSEEFSKYYAHRLKILKRKGKEEQTKIEENMDVVKLRIQYFGPVDLLKEVQERGYDIEKHYKSFYPFRNALLQIYRRQNQSKKFINLLKSTKNITPHQTKSNLLAKNKSKIDFLVCYPEQVQENRQKIEQEAFNRRVLNGQYLREQIQNDIMEGRAQFLEGYKENEVIQERSILTNSSISNTKIKSEILSKINGKGDSRRSGKEDQLLTNLNQTKTKIIGFDLSGTTSSFPSRPLTPTKKEIPLTTQNFYQKISERVRGEVFYGLGHKILNK